MDMMNWFAAGREIERRQVEAMAWARSARLVRSARRPEGPANLKAAASAPARRGLSAG